MAAALEEVTGMKVILWDERRTTIDAHQILFNQGKDGRKRRKIVDAVAASLILDRTGPRRCGRRRSRWP